MDDFPANHVWWNRVYWLRHCMLFQWMIHGLHESFPWRRKFGDFHFPRLRKYLWALFRSSKSMFSKRKKTSLCLAWVDAAWVWKRGWIVVVSGLAERNRVHPTMAYLKQWDPGSTVPSGVLSCGCILRNQVQVDMFETVWDTKGPRCHH